MSTEDTFHLWHTSC